MDELTDSDMRELLTGTASAEMRRKYGEQLKDPYSFANRWMDAIHAASSDPFDISMTRLMAVGEHVEQQQLVELVSARQWIACLASQGVFWLFWGTVFWMMGMGVLGVVACVLTFIIEVIRVWHRRFLRPGTLWECVVGGSWIFACIIPLISPLAYARAFWQDGPVTEALFDLAWAGATALAFFTSWLGLTYGFVLHPQFATGTHSAKKVAREWLGLSAGYATLVFAISMPIPLLTQNQVDWVVIVGVAFLVAVFAAGIQSMRPRVVHIVIAASLFVAAGTVAAILPCVIYWFVVVDRGTVASDILVVFLSVVGYVGWARTGLRAYDVFEEWKKSPETLVRGVQAGFTGQLGACVVSISWVLLIGVQPNLLTSVNAVATAGVVIIATFGFGAYLGWTRGVGIPRTWRQALLRHARLWSESMDTFPKVHTDFIWFSRAVINAYWRFVTGRAGESVGV